MKYFSSLRHVELLPSFCGYVNTSYIPMKGKDILLAPSRGLNPTVANLLFSSLMEFNAQRMKSDMIRISAIRTLYPIHYDYSDLSSHPAIVIIPYQVSIMSLFEYYRMAIPLFAPSIDLMTRWHIDYNVLNERTWSSAFGDRSHHSAISRHPNSSSFMQFDPNDDLSFDAVKEWVSLGDIYQWPHIIQFDSFLQLYNLLETTNLSEVSHAMTKYNEKVRDDLFRKWEKILDKISRYKQEKEELGVSASLPDHMNAALIQQYGIQLDTDNCEGYVQ